MLFLKNRDLVAVLLVDYLLVILEWTVLYFRKQHLVLTKIM